MRLNRVARALRAVIVPAVVAALVAFPLGVLASHSFSDVPTNHPFHADIAALKDSGVSPTGCGGGKFCPDDFVTRGQMAAFLNRLGALGPGKVPVANADKLDGLDSTAFVRSDQTPRYAMVAMGPEAPTTTTSTAFVDIADMSVVIDIPNNKMADLIITFSAMVNTCDAMRVRATIDGTEAVPSWTQFQWNFSGGADSHAFTFFQKGIGSGPHTVAMQWKGLTTCDHQYMAARSLVVTANIH